MRLGVVFAGDGVHAAANLGVLEDLYARGMEPYAVCGIHAGAWPAALFGAGHDMENMKKALHQAARMGKRLADGPLTFPWKRGGASILRSGRIEHLLRAQTGDRMLALCPRRALFLCRAAVSGRRVIFSSQLYLQDAGALLSMQAGAGFAARAAMALPPFLPPVAPALPPPRTDPPAPGTPPRWFRLLPRCSRSLPPRLRYLRHWWQTLLPVPPRSKHWLRFPLLPWHCLRPL